LAEEYEYEAILSRMLSKVPDDVDKREGSIIYQTLSPCAFELAAAYYMLGYMFNLCFADTSEGEWLDRVVSDFGITRRAATNSIRQINTFDSSGKALDVPMGSKFGINELTFTLTEKIAAGQFKAVCSQTGTQGDVYSGAVLPIDNINGLGSATLVSTPLIPAADTETDDALRTRFYLYVRQAAFGGNIADYEQKTLAVEGVGSVKVFTAVDQGAGNVGVVIGDDNGDKATKMLIDKVQALMGTNGNGIAPIGHTVTVCTSTDLTVSVSAAIKLKIGASFEAVKPVVTKTITDYINNIGFNDTTVFYAKLVAAILNCHDSIVDVGTVAMNGSSSNITLTKTVSNYQVPVLGTVTVTQVTT
jgi:uncharacterized phage protein gp47/JayE